MAAVADVEAGVEKLVARLGRAAPFSESLVWDADGESAVVTRRSTSFSAAPHVGGAVFRIWTGARWAEAATSDLSERGLDAIAELLERSIARANGHAPPPGVSSTLRAEAATRPKHPARDLGPDGLLNEARRIRDLALTGASIGEAQARVSWSDATRLYLNSSGARCLQTVSRVHGLLVPIAMESGRSEMDYLIRAGEGGREIIERVDETSIRRSTADSAALLKAKAPPAGEMNVLLDPTVTGLFAHESFGHGTEADQFLRDRSYLKPLLGTMVGPESLTLSDDGAVPNAWGSIFFDDEGHPGGKTKLVDRGRFAGALHDRETAAAFGVAPTGNARRSEFPSRSFVRMTNTYVEPGDLSKEELLEEMGDGIVLEHGSSGIEDPLGGQMQLKLKRGHLVEHGKTTDLVGSMALSGNVLTFLRAIRGIGRRADFELDAGFCGKGHGDYVPVGSGGAYLLSRAVVGPA